MYASKNGHSGVVDLLLENGAISNLKDKAGKTAPYYAAENGHEKIVKTFGFPENFQKFIEASRIGNVKVIKILLKKVEM